MIAGSTLRDLITVPQERRGPSFTTRQESRQTLSNLPCPSSPPSRLMEVNTNKEPFSRILLEKFAEFTRRNILPLDRKLPIAHEIMKIVLRIDNLMKLLCITHNCRCFNFNCDDRNLCICYFPICVLPRIVKR